MARLAQDHGPAGAASRDTAALRSLGVVTSKTSSGYPHTLRMLRELPEHLCSEGMGDLGIKAGVLDVFVAQMIGHVLDAAAGLQEMHGHRVAQRVDRPAFNSDFFGIVRKELLDHALLERAFPAGE
jgi:hypothetical protein